MVGYFTVGERECRKRGEAIAEGTIGYLRVYKICAPAERKEIFTF